MRKILRKTINIFLIIIFTLFLTSCGNDDIDMTFREEYFKEVNEKLESGAIALEENIYDNLDLFVEKVNESKPEDIRKDILELKDKAQKTIERTFEEVRELDEPKKAEKKSIKMQEEIPEEELYYVERVIDGDTVILSIDDKSVRVRLIGIDTPESVHSDKTRNSEEGIIASDFTKELLFDKYVAIELDVEEYDRYDRLLAYLYLDGKMVNKTLLEEGYAQVATFPPNVKYVDDFLEIQRVARENKAGLWSYEGGNNENKSEMKMQSKRDEEMFVIGSINSNKYHIKGYAHNGQISKDNIVEFKSEEDAKEKGYIPCKLCFK